MVTLKFWGTVSHPQISDTGYPGTLKLNTDVICYIIILGRMPICVVFIKLWLYKIRGNGL